ncbi:uncharacterized protein BCR38DRAFT_19906 [Pseudomassariella vexata]|uniref:Uncharacterized protein n=1 Tax=Pseudomassariella vexata TaxID=1141098 RepID=A0A1Y2EJN5_9PEZI|nr:uncharacterized protein BCR38DRAFT_19906 [Pseudomassariella vexata]ORY71772.1 hypothetical protein BCR38DRAFT_19906 [Pseudomassariella vexata]
MDILLKDYISRSRSQKAFHDKSGSTQRKLLANSRHNKFCQSRKERMQETARFVYTGRLPAVHNGCVQRQCQLRAYNHPSSPGPSTEIYGRRKGLQGLPVCSGVVFSGAVFHEGPERMSLSLSAHADSNATTTYSNLPCRCNFFDAACSKSGKDTRATIVTQEDSVAMKSFFTTWFRPWFQLRDPDSC